MLTNDELKQYIVLAKENNQDAIEIIIKSFEPLLFAFSKKYYAKGADSQDIVQVGRIGLYEAVKKFDLDKTENTSRFLIWAMKNRIKTFMRDCNRQKHYILNHPAEIQIHTLKNNNGEAIDFEKFIKDKTDIEKSCIERETLLEVQEVINSLNGFQNQVFILYVNGYRQKEIKEKLKLSSKQVDNAITRVKYKFKELMIA